MRIDTFKTLCGVVLLAFLAAPVFAQEASAPSPDTPAPAKKTAAAEPVTNDDTQVIRQLSQSLVEAFNAKKADDLVALFLTDAELIDDAGNIHRGQEGIKDVFTRFIELFPDAKMELNIETVRLAAGELAIENGTRTVSTASGDETATNGYTMVYVKRDGSWKIAVAREVPDDPQPTPHDQLQPLAWLEGEWVDEDAEAAITIACRWDKSGNFLLLDFVATREGETVMESRQRVGWDPLTKSVRSWVFDSDGGFGEGRWAVVDGTWIIKSMAVLPDGTTGSATIFIEPTSEDRFLMKGFDRVLGQSVEPDFEATIVRKPPQPAG